MSEEHTDTKEHKQDISVDSIKKDEKPLTEIPIPDTKIVEDNVEIENWDEPEEEQQTEEEVFGI